ncbi:MAG: T9SS type A sorting domain-containing protein [Bacteroidetes bacterium]|nr:T9SS type A sorting domain-containing protein [Bacteroidota bacterium]
MFISIDNQEEGNVSVDLFNLVGQKVKTVTFEIKQDVYSIDLSDLQEGAYLYRVNKGKEGNPTATSKLTIGKIIITKGNK